MASTTQGPTDSVTGDVDVLAALLRGEVAAADSYERVTDKFQGKPEEVELGRIREEHTETAAVLRERVRHSGGDPDESAGLWGSLTAAVTGTATVFGPATALATLRQGEEYGIGQFEAALNDPAVAPSDKELIRTRLLPRAHAHVAALVRMIEPLMG